VAGGRRRCNRNRSQSGGAQILTEPVPERCLFGRCICACAPQTPLSANCTNFCSAASLRCATALINRALSLATAECIYFMHQHVSPAVRRMLPINLSLLAVAANCKCATDASESSLWLIANYLVGSRCIGQAMSQNGIRCGGKFERFMSYGMSGCIRTVQFRDTE
jgi:hypothetical protein